MARTTLRNIVFGLTATGLLAACVEGAGPAASDGAGSNVAAPEKVRVGQEIEAPEVFQATESALWDGRPSLGGTWVASPDAVDPERVVMFNPATGKSVTGALFRRERENPGPRLQLSSDAAEALGVLAGQPTEIRVVALRKQEAPEQVVAEVPVTPEAEPADAEVAETDDAAAAATAAAAAAALDAADAGSEVDPTVSPAEDGLADGTVAAEETEPAPLTWKERRAKAKAEREAKKAAAAAAKAAAAEADADALGTDAVAATVESAGVAAIETAPLDAGTPDVASDPTDEPVPASPEVTEEAADPVAEAPAPSGAVRSIQIASFSKEENATRAVQALAKIGITATIQKSDNGGKPVWGVVASGDDTMLQSIKDAGFADAYFLK
jgi:rare lipoprotein A